jgi:hypothetical protein
MEMDVITEREEYLHKTYGHHGGAWDRGSADSYYRRGKTPHTWPDGTYSGRRAEEAELTAEEIEAYHAGYAYNEKDQNFKMWE